MLPMDRAITTIYKLLAESNHVSVCSGLAAILNAMLLPAAVTYVHHKITLS